MNIFRYLIKMMRDERGEVGELTPDALAEGFVPEDMPDETDETKTDSIDETKDQKETEDAEDTETYDTDTEGKKDEHSERFADFEKKFKDLDDKLSRSQKGNAELAAENRRLKREAKEKDKAPKLTDEQLLKIMSENKDDPSVTLRVMKHMMEQGKIDNDKAVENAAEIAEQRRTFTGLMKQIHPDSVSEGSDLHNKIVKTAETLGLDNHPHGEFLALAAMHYQATPSLVKDLEEKFKAKHSADKADADKKTLEQKRKENIDKTKLSEKGKKQAKTSGTLTDSQEDACKAVFGPNPTKEQRALYIKMVGGKSQAAA